MSLRLKYGHSQILLPTSSSSQHTIPSLPTATSGHSWSEALSQLHSPFAQLALSTSKSYQLHPQNTSFPPGPHRVRTATSLAWIPASSRSLCFHPTTHEPGPTPEPAPGGSCPQQAWLRETMFLSGVPVPACPAGQGLLHRRCCDRSPSTPARESTSF